MGEVNVKAIFDESFKTVTKKMTGLALRGTNTAAAKKECYEGLIHTKGQFAADIRFFWNASLYEYIASNMVHEDSLTEEEKILYINEYMNITCGHALSNINNRMGPPPSRLSIPRIFHEEKPCESGCVEDGTETEELCYDSEHGMMYVKIGWSSGKKGVEV